MFCAIILSNKILLAFILGLTNQEAETVSSRKEPKSVLNKSGNQSGTAENIRLWIPVSDWYLKTDFLFKNMKEIKRIISTTTTTFSIREDS